MKRNTCWISLVAVLCCMFGSVPAQASGFSLFGSYLDLDEPEGALGLGIRFEVELGSNWTVDFAVSYHEQANVFLVLDIPGVNLVEETTFIPFDVGARYHFGDSDGMTPYLGGGLSILEIDTKIGESDALTGLYGVVGVAIGDDIGAKFFVEGGYRVYEDVELDLFEGLNSNNRTEFSVDGFSFATGIRWSFGR